MKCSYCQQEYPSKNYFIYGDHDDPCIYCFENKQMSCELLIKGLNNFSSINSPSIWLKKLEHENIISDRDLFNFIKLSIKYMLPLHNSPQSIETTKLSISDWLFELHFKAENIFIHVLILLLFVLLVINSEIHLIALNVLLILLLAIAFHRSFLTGKKCTFNLNYGYLEVKIQNYITQYLNLLPIKLINYQDIKIIFEEIEEIQIDDRQNGNTGDYIFLNAKLKTGEYVTLGYLLNLEFASAVKKILDKFIYKNIDLRDGLLRCA